MRNRYGQLQNSYHRIYVNSMVEQLRVYVFYSDCISSVLISSDFQTNRRGKGLLFNILLQASFYSYFSTEINRIAMYASTAAVVNSFYEWCNNIYFL